MKKLNILFITEYFPPYTKGGAEISTSLLIKEVSNYHNCYILTNDFQKTAWFFGNSEVFPFFKRNEITGKGIIGIIKNELKYYSNISVNKKTLFSLIDEKKIDMIHLIPTGYHALPLLKSALDTSKPLMIDNRDGTIACPIAFAGKCEKNFSFSYRCMKCLSKNYSTNLGFLNFLKIILSSYEVLRFKILRDFLMKKINRKSTVVLTANSNYIKERLAASGYEKKKINVIYNICDFRYDKNSYKKENKIVFAGALEKSKGIWVAIRAFESLTFDNLCFDIAGTGREMDSIKKYIDDNKIKNITLLGRINHEDVYELYFKSKIIIAPSIWPEPFGRFILESIATGVPVIATTTGGTPEGIRNYETGLLVEPCNHVQLAEAISELLSNKVLYNKICSNLLKESDKYAPETIGKQRMDLYLEVINKNN